MSLALVQQRLISLSPALWIFLLALAIRVIYLISSQGYYPGYFISVDSSVFLQYAKTITAGINAPALALGLPVTPFYISFLTICFKVLGFQPLSPQLAQIVIGSLSCSAIYAIGKSIWTKKVGVLAGIISACYGIFIFYDIQILKPSLANSFLIFTFFFFLFSFKNHYLRYFFAALTFSFAVMLREQLILLLPLFLLTPFIFKSEPMKTRLLGTLLFLISFAAIIFLGNQNLISGTSKNRDFGSVGGIHFYIGNHKEANGSYTPVPNIQASPQGHFFEARALAEKETGESLTPNEANSFWYRKTLSEIKSDPINWLKIELRKLHHLLNVYEIPNDENYPFYKRQSWVLGLPWFSFGLIAPLGIIGMGLSLKQKGSPSLILIFAVCLYSLSLLAGFVTSSYRMPLHPFFILFASLSIIYIAELIVDRKYGVLKKLGIIFLILFVITNSESTLPKSRYDYITEQRIDLYRKHIDQIKSERASALRPKSI